MNDPPAVYCSEATANDTDPAFYEREFAKESQREEFFSANAALRRFYDGMIDQIAAAVGPLEGISVLDVGCNTGYFPLAFAQRGVRRSKGIDRIDYSPTISLLNEICGTSVQFSSWRYDGSLTAFERHDLVLSIAVLVHLSEPLRHLAWLGSSARKALMVFTPCHDRAEHSITFEAANRYYTDAKFPNCFDVTTLSKPLLRLAFEKMGFTRIIEITAGRDVMPPGWTDVHLGLLGIRENSVPFEPPNMALDEVSMEERDQRLGGYVRELLLPLHDKIDEQAEQVQALESTVMERTIRLDSMERTVDERTRRITSLEASLEERDQRLRALEAATRWSVRYRLGSLIKAVLGEH